MDLPNDQSVQSWTVKIQQNKAVLYPLFILLLVFAGAAFVRDALRSPVRSATVVGIGKTKVKPETATVTFSYTLSANTQEEAIEAGERQFGTLLNSISAFNPEIERTGYQVILGNTAAVPTPATGTTPQLPSLSRRVGSFQYINAARVTVSDPAVITDVVRNLYNNGATTVTPIRYIPADEDKVNREVRELAVKDARERIAQMARASGARVGRVITIQEGDLSGQTEAALGAALGSQPTQSSGVNVDSEGNVEIQAVVSVSYELK